MHNLIPNLPIMNQLFTSGLAEVPFNLPLSRPLTPESLEKASIAYRAFIIYTSVIQMSQEEREKLRRATTNLESSRDDASALAIKTVSARFLMKFYMDLNEYEQCDRLVRQYDVLKYENTLCQWTKMTFDRAFVYTANSQFETAIEYLKKGLSHFELCTSGSKSIVKNHLISSSFCSEEEWEGLLKCEHPGKSTFIKELRLLEIRILCGPLGIGRSFTDDEVKSLLGHCQAVETLSDDPIKQQAIVVLIYQSLFPYHNTHPESVITVGLLALQYKIPFYLRSDICNTLMSLSKDSGIVRRAVDELLKMGVDKLTVYSRWADNDDNEKPEEVYNYLKKAVAENVNEQDKALFCLCLGRNKGESKEERIKYLIVGLSYERGGLLFLKLWETYCSLQTEGPSAELSLDHLLKPIKDKSGLLVKLFLRFQYLIDCDKEVEKNYQHIFSILEFLLKSKEVEPSIIEQQLERFIFIVSIAEKRLWAKLLRKIDDLMHLTLQSAYLFFLALAKGNLQTTMRSFEDAYSCLSSAELYLEGNSTKAKKLPLFNFCMGRMHLFRGDRNQAITHYTMAILQLNNSLKLSEPPRFNELYFYLYHSLSNGDPNLNVFQFLHLDQTQEGLYLAGLSNHLRCVRQQKGYKDPREVDYLRKAVRLLRLHPQRDAVKKSLAEALMARGFPKDILDADKILRKLSKKGVKVEILADRSKKFEETDLYDQDEEDKLEKKSIITHRLVPLVNQGTICFANASFQIIMHTPALKECLVESIQENLLKEPNSKVKEFLEFFLHSVLKYERGEKRINLEGLRGLLPEGNQLGYQDASEFLNVLFKYINPQKHPQFFFRSHMDRYYKPFTTEDVELEDTQMQRAAIKCSSGENVSTLGRNMYLRHQGELDFQFNIDVREKAEGATVDILTELQTAWNFNSPLKTDSPPIFKNEKGEYGPFEVTKERTVIESNPSFFVVNLKLFKFDDSGRRSKVEIAAKVPMEIQINESHLELCSSLVHFGDIDHGHYIALIKREGAWFCFDDSVINIVSEEDFPKILKKSYMLFYRAKEVGKNESTVARFKSDADEKKH